MRRFMVLAIAVVLVSAAPNPYQNIFQVDISPEEAQKYLNNPPFTDPQLSARTAVLKLVKYDDPQFRTAEAGPTLGHYWKNGKEIENPNDYVEEVYNAAQYHGQDGLGAYAYGYQTPESAKTENRVRSGDVSGSYIYRAGSNNELIKVRYWADSQGFHQEDNLPKVVLKPQEEAPDVRAARIAHEKAWQEAAAASRKQPDPQYNLHRGEYNPAYDYQGQASEQQTAYVAAPEQSQAREGKAYSGSDYQSGFQSYPSTTPKYYEETEPTGPPRGFFYSFEYPVSIIVPKNQENSNYPSYSDAVSVNSARQ